MMTLNERMDIFAEDMRQLAIRDISEILNNDKSTRRNMKRITIACNDDPRMCKRMLITYDGYYCDIIKDKCFSHYVPDTTEKSAKEWRDRQPSSGFPSMNRDGLE